LAKITKSEIKLPKGDIEGSDVAEDVISEIVKTQTGALISQPVLLSSLRVKWDDEWRNADPE